MKVLPIGIPTVLVAIFLVHGFLVPRIQIRASDLQPGDILFQSLPSSELVIAIEGATKSGYSHCGILCEENGRKMILEAIGPVRYTGIFEFIERARDNKYYVYRFTPEHRPRIEEILREAEKYLGVPYDLRYRMDDDAIYCSELIYKAFKKVTGESLGELQRFGDMNWEPYRTTVIKYEGSNTIPVDRVMITPQKLSEANQLEFIGEYEIY